MKILFKTTAILLIQAFLLLDIAFAGGTEIITLLESRKDDTESQLSCSFLAPEIILNKDIIQGLFLNFLRGIDKKSQIKYQAGFSFPEQISSPRWVLEADKLDELFGCLGDIVALITLLGEKEDAFADFLRDGEKEYINEIILIDPLSIDVAREDEYAQSLRKILRKGLKNLQQRRYYRPELALREEYNLLLNRLQRKFQKALALLTPQMPIEYIRFNENIEQQLPEKLLKRIRENISWEKINPDNYSGQRKIILELDEPIITTSGKEISAVEIKGVVYRKKGIVSPPLQSLYRAMAVQRLDKQNLLRISARIHLKGALPLACARREYMILKRLQKAGKTQADYPIGFGQYLGYTFNGKKFGFLITGVSKDKKERFGDWFLNEYYEVFQLTRLENKRFSQLGVKMFKKHPERLRKYGEALRKFHDEKYYHGFPHLLNAVWDEEKQEVRFADFEASKVMEAMPIERRVGYRLLDLASAYSHFLVFIFGSKTQKSDLIDLSKEISRDKNPFYLFLEGYFGKKFKNNDLDKLFSEFVELSCCGIVEPLFEMDQGIVKLLFSIEERGNKRKGSLLKSIKGGLIPAVSIALLSARTVFAAEPLSFFELSPLKLAMHFSFFDTFLVGIALIFGIGIYRFAQKIKGMLEPIDRIPVNRSRRDFLHSASIKGLIGFLMLQTGALVFLKIHRDLDNISNDLTLRPQMERNLIKLALFYEQLPQALYEENKRIALPMNYQYWQVFLNLENKNDAVRAAEIYRDSAEKILEVYSLPEFHMVNMTTPHLIRLIAAKIVGKEIEIKSGEREPVIKKTPRFNNASYETVALGLTAAGFMNIDVIDEKPLVGRVEKIEKAPSLKNEGQKEDNYRFKKKQKKKSIGPEDKLSISEKGRALSKILKNMNLVEEAI